MAHFNFQDMDELETMKSNIALETLLRILLTELPDWQASIALGQFKKNREGIRQTIRKRKEELIKLIGEV